MRTGRPALQRNEIAHRQSFTMSSELKQRLWKIAVSLKTENVSKTLRVIIEDYWEKHHSDKPK